MALRLLRKKYDNIHKSTQEKQVELELIKVSYISFLTLTVVVCVHRKE